LRAGGGGVGVGVGEPGRHVQLVCLGGFSDGCGEFRFEGDGESFDGHDVIMLRHTTLLHDHRPNRSVAVSARFGPPGPTWMRFRTGLSWCLDV
jgi:hypothetical protein